MEVSVLPTIRVDDEVYEALGRRALPFVDKTPNDVLRRLLVLDEGTRFEDGAPVEASMYPVVSIVHSSTKRSQRKRPRVPGATPKEVYRVPILEILVESGGRADSRTVLDILKRSIQLLPSDLESTSSGGIRWENRANWARMDMVIEGLIRKGSPRGVWEITDSGRQALAVGRI